MREERVAGANTELSNQGYQYSSATLMNYFSTVGVPHHVWQVCGYQIFTPWPVCSEHNKADQD